MEYIKVCVEVVARFRKDGGMRPQFIVWQDGRRYQIEKVKFCERAPARVSAVLPLRYTCVIEGREKWLYFEPNELRWFVEIPA